MGPRLMRRLAAAVTVAAAVAAATAGSGAATPAAVAAAAAAVPLTGRQAATDSLPTISEIVAGSDDFNLLEAALKAADLFDTLDDAAASFTVFAPNDDAFVTLAAVFGYDGTDEGEALAAVLAELTTIGGGADPAPLLATILKYHVTAGAVGAEKLLAAGGYTPLEGAFVKIGADNKTIIDGAPSIDDAMLVATDIPASNGVVHVISGVLLPAELFKEDGTMGAPMETAAPVATAAPMATATPKAKAAEEVAPAKAKAAEAKAAAKAKAAEAKAAAKAKAAEAKAAAKAMAAEAAAMAKATPKARAAPTVVAIVATPKATASPAVAVKATPSPKLVVEVTAPVVTAAPKTVAVPVGKTIAELAVATPDLSLLVKALTAAGLVDVVAEAKTSLTVFAPTNKAFLALAHTLGYVGVDADAAFAFIVKELTTLGKGDPLPLLKDILTYHVLPTKLGSASLLGTGPKTTVQGGKLSVTKDGEVVDLAPAVINGKIVTADVAASNGVVHLVSRVLLPLAICPSTTATYCAHLGAVFDAQTCLCVIAPRVEQHGTVVIHGSSVVHGTPVVHGSPVFHGGRGHGSYAPRHGTHGGNVVYVLN